MATGIVSSAHNLQNAAVLRTGERIATTQAALTSKSGKTFYHMIPGAKFVMPDGLEIVFLGGRFTTDDPAIISELGKVADKSTSLIYTQLAVKAAITGIQSQAATDAVTQ